MLLAGERVAGYRRHKKSPATTRSSDEGRLFAVGGYPTGFRAVSSMARGTEKMTQMLDDTVAELRRANAELQRLLEESRAELTERDSQYGERIEQQSATVDVLKVMSASPGDPKPVFDLITRRARELCSANAAALWSFDGELIHFLSNDAPGSTSEMDAAYRRQFPMSPTRGGSFGRAILDRQIVHIRDADADPEIAQFVRDLGMRSIVAVPLLRDGTVIGWCVHTLRSSQSRSTLR